MSQSRRKQAAYKELGELLKNWRSERFRSRLAFVKSAQPDFSYSAYVDFENGSLLPSIKNLIEIAQCLGKDASPALLLWAKVQMPTPEFKKLFDPGQRGTALPFAERRGAQKAEPQKIQDETELPSIENSWVFGPMEQELLSREPWVWDIFLALSTSYPEPVPFAMLPAPEERLRTLLAHWINHGYLIESQDGIRLKYPHIHLPKSKEFSTIRKNNLVRVLESLSSASRFQALVHRPLNKEQSERWVKKLEALEREFKSEPYVMSPDELQEDHTHALLIAYGDRKLKKSPHQ